MSENMGNSALVKTENIFNKQHFLDNRRTSPFVLLVQYLFRCPWKLPLSVPVPVVEPGGQLHLCLSCRRRMTLCNHHDPAPLGIQGVFLTKREILHKHPGRVGADTIRNLEVRRGGDTSLLSTLRKNSGRFSGCDLEATLGLRLQPTPFNVPQRDLNV